MASRKDSASQDDRRRARQERARRTVAAALADETFMQGVRDGLESERRGEGTPFNDLKRKHGRR